MNNSVPCLTISRQSRLEEGLANLGNDSTISLCYTLQFLLQLGMNAECKARVFCRH